MTLSRFRVGWFLVNECSEPQIIKLSSRAREGEKKPTQLGSESQEPPADSGGGSASSFTHPTPPRGQRERERGCPVRRLPRPQALSPAGNLGRKCFPGWHPVAESNAVLSETGQRASLWGNRRLKAVSSERRAGGGRGARQSRAHSTGNSHMPPAPLTETASCSPFGCR